MGLLKKIKKKVKKVGKVFLTLQTLPLTPVGGAMRKAEKTILDPTKEITKSVIQSALIGGVVLAPAQVGGFFGRALLPKSVLGGVSRLVGGIAFTTALTKSPKLREAVVDIPETLVDIGVGGGEILAGAIEDPTKVPKLPEAVKKGGVIGAGAVIGAGVVTLLPKLGKDKIPKVPPIFKAPPGEQLITEKPIGIEGETPITPQTTTITTGKKPSKRRRKKKTPSVRQSVKINIINKPKVTGMKITNKRYISPELVNL